MESRAHAIIAVTFLVVFSLGVVIVYYWLAHQKNEPLTYEIVTSQSVGGLAAQSEVLFKGITVGHITRIGFDPANRARVIVCIALQPKTYVTHATYAEITMRGITGGDVLELKLGKGSDAPLKTSDAHPAHIPMRQGALASLMSEAPEIMQSLKGVIADAHKVLDQANREHIAESLAQIDTATARLAAVEAQLSPLLQGVQRSVTESHALIANTNRLVRTAQKPVENAAQLEASIEALVRSSRQLSERLDRQTVPGFDTLSISLERTSRELDQLLRELKAKPQSLIFGPPRQPPGPGEPGFDGRKRQEQHP